MLIRTTYDIVTEESCANGDFSENGWDDQEGCTFEDVKDAVRFLCRHSPLEASCYPWSADAWYSQTSQSIGYGERRLSFHLVDFTYDEAKAVYQQLKEGKYVH